MSNVIHLPRPKANRPNRVNLGLYFRVGHNHHKDLLETLGRGNKDFLGFVIDASSVERHSELHSRASQEGLDTILDPKSHALAFPGSFSPALTKLPWADEHHHRVSDFSGSRGHVKAAQIAEFAYKHRFTQVLAPTHVLKDEEDEWLKLDIQCAESLRRELDQLDRSIQVIYPLSLPMKVFRDEIAVAKLVLALQDVSATALWLRIENFGSDSTGEKTSAYIRSARKFHSIGIPIVGDHVGGLNGLGLLAFGAVGGLSHGITMQERFQVNHWRKPRLEGSGGGLPIRVYIPQLDLMLKRRDAKDFLRSSTTTRGRFGCRDTHCCPGGISDMLTEPTNHFVHQRIAEVNRLSDIPESVRIQQYLERSVRNVSDEVTAAANFSSISSDFREVLVKKQLKIARFRKSISHLMEIDNMSSISQIPESYSNRRKG